MERKYQPLQPAPSASDSPVIASGPAITTALNTRRRVGVAVACSGCRRRKSRCDGSRPICAECQKRGISLCTYERGSSSGSDSNSTSNSDGGSLIEAVRLLNAMDPEQVTHILRTFQDERSTSAILFGLRSGLRATGDIPRQPSMLAAVSGTAQRFGLDIELGVLCPFVYPSIDSVDMGDFSSSLQWLVEPYRGMTTRPTHMSGLTTCGSPQVSIQSSEFSSTTDLGLESAEQDIAVTQPPHVSTPIIADNLFRDLRISFWTSVPISNEFAAKIILLYLKTDHPLLGSFQPELFIRDLIDCENVHCSSLLVNALMYWACQMYSAIDYAAEDLVEAFGAEAEGLWAIGKDFPSAVNMTAAQFLSLAYMVRGKDHVVLQYLSEAVRMGSSMGLFGIDQRVAQQTAAAFLPPQKLRAISYSAWGIFNWATFMGVFYHQPGVLCPKFPPVLAIPDTTDEPSPLSPAYYTFFPVLCNFWRIMNEVAAAYYTESSEAIHQRVPLQFAEFKFRELLAWSSTLSSNLAQSGPESHLVINFHLWLHAAILDIFRPFLQGLSQTRLELKTFYTPLSSPDAAYAVSVTQLKRLILTYRRNHASSTHSMLWHTALLYVANAMLHSTDDEDWLNYFLLCLHGYGALCRPYRFIQIIPKSLLSMAMLNGKITGAYARSILTDMQDCSLPNHSIEPIRATFMMDLKRAVSEPKAATVEELADAFEENASFKDFTNVFEEE